MDYVPNDVLGGIYMRARAFVMPTFYGPTNIPPLEAIALGCPVAVSNIYGMPNQLGDAALYFDNTSSKDVANCIERLWLDDHLSLQLKENGQKHFNKWNQTHFDARLKFIFDHHGVQIDLHQ